MTAHRKLLARIFHTPISSSLFSRRARCRRGGQGVETSAAALLWSREACRGDFQAGGLIFPPVGAIAGHTAPLLGFSRGLVRAARVALLASQPPPPASCPVAGDRAGKAPAADRPSRAAPARGARSR